MRLQVQVGVECIVVPCSETETVHQVAERAVAKIRRLRPDCLQSDKYLEVRRTIGNSLLDPTDVVSQVLKDGDFILIAVEECETEAGKLQRRLSEIETTEKQLKHFDPRERKFGMFSSFHFDEYFRVSFAFDPSPDLPHVIKPTKLLIVDGNSLEPIDLVRCERGECAIQLSMEAEERVRKSRLLLEKIAADHKSELFFALKLQVNLIRSHSTGYGKPLSPSKTRMLLALRINILAKGYSGISVENLKKMIAAFNAYCVSYVPQQGTVGCSGDLCPLAHLALGLLGEGKMWSPSTGWGSAEIVLKKNHLEPLVLGPKEGLALINGTQMVTALGAYSKSADVIAALSLDVLKGTTRAYDPDIHRIRPHTGQNLSALRLRSLLHSEANPSQIAESHRNCSKVQDAYTLRCVPQVHGIVHDTIEFVKGIIRVEMNSATDNPLVFADREEIISGGNFHGEYPAKALDYLAIAVSELAQMSERRLERLVNHDLSGLPTFLTPDGGLNSGFMTVQLCAASLVSENKEDHVSMGGFAARKALTIVEHVEAVLAMELLAACQGIEFLLPLRSTAPLHKVYKLVRQISAPLTEDRSMHGDIEAVVALLRENKVWETVLPHLETLEAMEELDPDALRLSAKTPTGIVMADRVDLHETDESDDEHKH
ncbi:hypothetical protein WR25_12781 [Diploscapter pachys]|uniref:Histidine ammonia-lyase n=1 Tax=Diploscapter pachys TaxID=2018661 RepID=A0A2A2LGJ9_9BILA|nr:hypothetical protein WR25_12781 [Diploscapter pachys]